jgi:hypothetical protein
MSRKMIVFNPFIVLYRVDQLVSGHANCRPMSAYDIEDNKNSSDEQSYQAGQKNIVGYYFIELASFMTSYRQTGRFRVINVIF